MKENLAIIISMLYLSATGTIFWILGRYFRNENGSTSLFMRFSGLMPAIFFGVYVYPLSLNFICEKVSCEIQGEQAWQYVFISIFMVFLYWTLLVLSARRRSN
ncbi:MAG: hypothetical protein HY254_08130 [Burkholderiales bacterium]|nr:hypothetical protein [Burkholderiales bacterium]